jgi:two-component system response regulator YesN
VVRDNSEETKADAVVKLIKLIIENDLQNLDLDLEWVAAKVHFSSSYVRQIFKQYVGESLGEYLIRKRMERAGKLLQKTGLKIQEIAEECGYENQRYFASSFKKFYGCTPTEFKKVVEEEHLY